MCFGTTGNSHLSFVCFFRVLRFEKHASYFKELMSSKETHRSTQFESSELNADNFGSLEKHFEVGWWVGGGSTGIRKNVLGMTDWPSSLKSCDLVVPPLKNCVALDKLVHHNELSFLICQWGPNGTCFAGDFFKIIETKYLTHIKEYSNTCLDTMGILVYDNSQLSSHLSFIGMLACLHIIVD